VVLGFAGLVLILAGASPGGAPADVHAGAVVTVVVASHALDAGALIAAADVSQVRVREGEAVAALAHTPADVVGRRLAVAVPSGAPLAAMLLAPGGSSAVAGHRLVRLPVEASALPPDAAAGATVDVLAALPDGAEGGRVLGVATARVLGLTGAGAPVLTLDVDAAGASRLLWAQTFAKSLRLLVRPPGDQPPPDVGGLGR
jgi:Flp pilus assembly protein CpaB